MKVIVKENRELEIINPATTQNENKVEEIELEVPEQYKDFSKRIAYITDSQVGFSWFTNDKYTIPLAITRNSKMEFYIWLVKDEQDFRTVTKTVYFNNNKEVAEELTPEEQSKVDKYLAHIDSEIRDVNEYMTDFATFYIDEDGNLIMEVKEWRE